MAEGEHDGPSKRDKLRRLLNGAFRAGVAPLVLAYKTEQRVVHPMTARRLINSYGALLGYFPGFSGDFVRRAFYREVLADCHASATISQGTTFSSDDIVIAAGTYIGCFCNIGRSRIGQGVLIGDHVMIIPGRHTHQFTETGELDPSKDRQDIPIHIGDRTWIGARAIVMADVGARCTIGAGAVVVKPIPDDSVAVGNPARVVRQRSASTPR